MLYNMGDYAPSVNFKTYFLEDYPQIEIPFDYIMAVFDMLIKTEIKYVLSRNSRGSSLW